MKNIFKCPTRVVDKTVYHPEEI